MELKLSDCVIPAEWDKLSQKCRGSFFHTHAFATYDSRQSNQTALFVLALNKDLDCCGIAVFRIDTPKFWPMSTYAKRASMAALPAITDDSMLIPFMKLIEAKLKSIGIYTILIHSYESRNSLKILTELNYKLESRSEFYIDISADEDMILQKFKSNRRYDIRKAGKSGLTVKMETSLESILNLKSLQRLALSRKGIDINDSDSNSKAMKSMLVDKNQAITATSYIDARSLNAGMFGYFNEKAYYLISGSSPEGNKLLGPAYTIWQTIRYFKKKGFKTLNLGGVSEEEHQNQQGLYNFKKYFGAEIVAQPSGTKVISRFGYCLDALYRIIRHRS